MVSSVYLTVDCFECLQFLAERACTHACIPSFFALLPIWMSPWLQVLTAIRLPFMVPQDCVTKEAVRNKWASSLHDYVHKPNERGKKSPSPNFLNGLRPWLSAASWGYASSQPVSRHWMTLTFSRIFKGFWHTNDWNPLINARRSTQTSE